MRRRLPAVFLAALLTFAVSGCGDESDDSDEPTNDDTTSQTEEQTDDAEPTETDDTSEPPETDDATDDGDDKGDSDDDKNKNKNNNGNDDEDDGDDNGAVPDDLPSDNAADPDDLPIDAEVVIKTCEGVNPKDTWPSVDEVYFESDRQSVVATADVKVQGAKTAKTVCAVAGAQNNPQVMAYNAV